MEDGWKKPYIRKSPFEGSKAQDENEKLSAAERIRQAMLVGMFAGPLMHPEVKAWRDGMQAHALGLNSVANPYDDPALRWQWTEGYSLHTNMRWQTLRGAAERLPTSATRTHRLNDKRKGPQGPLFISCIPLLLV